MRSVPSTSKGIELVKCSAMPLNIVHVSESNVSLCVSGDELLVEPKSEKDKLKEKYPALCKPDAPAWTVRPVGAVEL